MFLGHSPLLSFLAAFHLYLTFILSAYILPDGVSMHSPNENGEKMLLPQKANSCFFKKVERHE